MDCKAGCRRANSPRTFDDHKKADAAVSKLISVISKAIVTNHSRPRGPHYCVIGLRVDLAVAPARVIEALKAAAAGSPHLAQGTTAHAYACPFNDALMDYDLALAIDSYALTQGARSAMIKRIVHAFKALAIATGKPAISGGAAQGQRAAQCADGRGNVL